MERIPTMDWVGVILNGIFCLGLIIFGFVKLPDSFGYIAIVFGAIGFRGAYSDLRSFLSMKSGKNEWLYRHMGGMIGAYIAALSAFSAVNFNFSWLPAIVQWLWPTAIGVPLMLIWMRSYNRKLKTGRSAKEMVTVKIQAEMLD